MVLRIPQEGGGLRRHSACFMTKSEGPSDKKSLQRMIESCPECRALRAVSKALRSEEAFVCTGDTGVRGAGMYKPLAKHDRTSYIKHYQTVQNSHT